MQDLKAGQPPQKKLKKKKKKKNPKLPPPRLTSLPEEILLNCLSRTSKSQYRVLSLYSKSLRSILSSRELYTIRSQIGNREPCLYLCKVSPTTYDRWFAVDRTLTTKGWIKDELSLIPITMPSTPPHPSNSTIVTVGYEIYQIGGTIDNNQCSSAVRVLDCRNHTWRDAPNMIVARKRARSAFFLDGKIFVFGGASSRPMHWAECFDLKTQTWNLLSSSPDDLFAHSFYLLSNDRYRPRCGIECVVEDVIYTFSLKKVVRWYDAERTQHFVVKGLDDLNRVMCYISHLGNYDGKLLIMWDEPQTLEFPVAGKTRKHLCKLKRIWCAVVRLEKRIGSFGLEMWGEIESSSALLTVPNSFNILTCITL